MSSVILINPFEIQEGGEDECLGSWGEGAEYQPGFISTKLHRAALPSLI